MGMWKRRTVICLIFLTIPFPPLFCALIYRVYLAVGIELGNRLKVTLTTGLWLVLGSEVML